MWYEATESSIIDHYRLVTPNEDSSLRALSLIDIQTSFYLLGIGLTLCTIVFVAELTCDKCCKRATGLRVKEEQHWQQKQQHQRLEAEDGGINNKAQLDFLN